jgi:hypothetical protein
MIRARMGSFLLLLILAIAGSTFAQEKVQSTGPPVFDTTSVPGATIIRLWQDKELGQPRWPEVAVIVMSSASAHKEFHRDPAAFLNKYKVFSKPVRTDQADCLIAPEDKEGTALSWVTYLHHTKGSGYT